MVAVDVEEGVEAAVAVEVESIYYKSTLYKYKCVTLSVPLQVIEFTLKN